MRPFLGYETVEAVHVEGLAAALYEGANAIFFHFSAFVVVVVMMVVPFFVPVFVLLVFVLLVFVFLVFVMPVFVSVVVCVLILLFIGMFVVRTLDTLHPSG